MEEQEYAFKLFPVAEISIALRPLQIEGLHNVLSNMDALGAMLDKLQKQVQVDIIEAGRSNRAADAKKAFTKVVNAEDAKLRTLFEKREAERKAKIQAALKELSEAEGASKHTAA